MSVSTSLEAARHRALEDLLESERAMRQAAEKSVRDLRQVLLEAALRLDGERLEALRRDNPQIPASWSSSDWRKFVQAIPASRWAGDGLEREKWQRERRELQQSELAAAVEREKARPVATQSQEATKPAAPVPFVPAGMCPPLAQAAAQAKAAVEKIPNGKPASYPQLDGGDRKGGDLARVWPRYWMSLYLIGNFGLSAQMEVEQALADAFDVSPGSGSIRRVLEDLIAVNILTVSKLSIGSPKSELNVVRLTADGERLFKSLFNARPVEGDWSRLIQMHEGERFPEHTLAVIAFAMHARRRGYATQVMPEVEGHARPDVAVANADGKRYVEVELSTKENTAKWRNLAELNGGVVALCAGTNENRARLVGDCKLLKLNGAATDLESLIGVSFKKASDTPLWLEAW